MKSTYTVIEMLEILNGDSSADLSNIMSMISENETKIFAQYPIFDENYRHVLNCKILTHYTFWEIGQETIALFLFTINRKMAEIMPYYNQLYENVLAMDGIDLKNTVDWYEKMEKEGVKEGSEEHAEDSTGKDVNEVNKNKSSEYSKNMYGNGKTETSNSVNNTMDGNTETNKTGDTWTKQSDTPQGNINGVRDTTYLTNLSHNTDTVTDNTNESRTTTNEASGTSDSSYNNMESGKTTDVGDEKATLQTSKNTTGNKSEKWIDTMDYVKHVYGIMDTSNLLDTLLKLRDAILNVDMMVIESLRPCFLGLWE